MNIAQRVAEIRTDMVLERYHPHMCERTYCLPQTEQHITHTPTANTTVFVCRFGQVHICDFDHCQCSVCPISGACYGHGGGWSSYDPSDPRTYEMSRTVDDEFPTFLVLEGLAPKETEPVLVKKRRTHYQNNGNVIKRAENVVETLLYSQERNKINTEYMQRQKKACTREKDTYVTQCKKNHQLPNMLSLDQINNRYKYNKPPLTIIKTDVERVAYYSDVIAQVYELVQRHSNAGSTDSQKICVVSVAIATLYKMRQSFQLEEVTLLPRDQYLVDHLPATNDLPRFNLDKKRFTSGEKLIEFAYDMAIKTGTPLHELQLEIRNFQVVSKPLNE